MEDFTNLEFVLSMVLFAIFCFALNDRIDRFFKKGETRKVSNKHELKVPEYQPVACEYRKRESEPTMIYSNDIIEFDEAVEEADCLIKAVEDSLKKKRDRLKIAESLGSFGKMKPL